MADTATTSVLKKDIQTALAELGRDRDVFERAEINSEAIQRSVEKYESVSTKLFDYFYDKYKSLHQKVEDIESQEKEFLASIQGYLKACVEAAHISGLQLAEIVKNRSCFSMNQVRADINLLNQTVKIMVLLIGNWLEAEGPSEEAMEQLSLIESDFLGLEDKFSHDYKLAILGYSNNIQIRIETHWLLIDSRLDTDSLTKDYPISVRL